MSISPEPAGYELGAIILKGAANTADLREALNDWPKISRGIDAAATLVISVDDHHRTLGNSPVMADLSFADYGDLRFDLVGVSKSGDSLSLTFEDAITRALRRQTSDLTIPGGTVRRRDVLERLCREAGVDFAIQPDSGVINAAVERKDGANSWDLTGSLATDIGWRRFSDGRRIVAGSDAWLATLNAPVTMREFQGACHGIDYEVDVGQPANRATIDVDARGWILLPGAPVILVDQGMANGQWLVESLERSEGITRQTVNLIRQRQALPEPPPEGNAADADAGEAGNLPSGSASGILTPPPGKYASTTLNAEQIGYAVRIAKVAATRSLGNRGAVLGIMCALQESTLRNLQGGDRDSAGLFQQRPSQGWGTKAQVTNPEYAAGAFYTRVVKVDQWATATPTKVIQAVQRSAYATAYAKWQKTAEALVGAMVSSSGNPTANVSAGGSSGKLAAIASDLAPKVPAYIWGGKDAARGLDCSGFVAECTKRNGKALSGGSVAQQKRVAAAGRTISVQQALSTPGALLFRIVGTQAKAGESNHVAISLGNGSTAEARGKAQGVGLFPGAAKRNWTHGGLWP